MATSSPTAKLISTLITKRGFFATASQGVVAEGTTRTSSAMVKKTGEEIIQSTKKVSWVPDPRTGFYRPENIAEEIDVAELRTMLWKKH